MIQKTKRSIQWIVENGAFFLQKKKRYAGCHLTADFWDGEAIEDVERLREILLESVKKSGSTPLEVAVHKFSPQGITGVVLLAESHIAVHTWPELNYVAIDIFTCGDKARPQKALDYLKKTLKPKRISIKRIMRGRVNSLD